MYNYRTQRPYVLTAQGQRRVFEVNKLAEKIIGEAGAVRLDKLLVGSGDSWDMLAVVDYLVELGTLQYYRPTDREVTQYKILIAGPTSAHYRR